jgi:hypothetical protein
MCSHPCCGLLMCIIYKTAQGRPRRATRSPEAKWRATRRDRKFAEHVVGDRLGLFLRTERALVTRAADLGFDLIERGDALEGLAGDRSRAGDSKFKEAAPAMRPVPILRRPASHVRHAGAEA